jgi:hypothetical protein
MSLLKEIVKIALDLSAQSQITKARKVGPYLAFYSEGGLFTFIKFDEFEANFMAENESWPYSDSMVCLPTELGKKLIVKSKVYDLRNIVNYPEILKTRPRTEVPEGYQEATLDVFWYCPYGRAGNIDYYSSRVFVKEDLQLEYGRD